MWVVVARVTYGTRRCRARFFGMQPLRYYLAGRMPKPPWPVCMLCTVPAVPTYGRLFHVSVTSHSDWREPARTRFPNDRGGQSRTYLASLPRPRVPLALTRSLLASLNAHCSIDWGCSTRIAVRECAKAPFPCICLRAAKGKAHSVITTRVESRTPQELAVRAHGHQSPRAQSMHTGADVK